MIKQIYAHVHVVHAYGTNIFVALRTATSRASAGWPRSCGRCDPRNSVLTMGLARVPKR